MEVTESSLASALEGFYVPVRVSPDRTGSYEVADADELARVIFATLSRMAALREPCHSDPHIPHQSCPGVPSPGSPAGPEDPELRVMRVLAEELAVFDALPPGPVERILRWACDRWEVR